MGDKRLELEEQRKNIKRYEDLCAFGAFFSLLMGFNDGPAKIAGYAIGIFGWFWWINRSKRKDLDRQIYQHEQAELIAAAMTVGGPDPITGSPSPHSPSSDARPPYRETTTPVDAAHIAPQQLSSSDRAQSGAGKVCPKCSHLRSENDELHVPEWQCPACGIAYAKFKPGQHQSQRAALASPVEASRASLAEQRKHLSKRDPLGGEKKPQDGMLALLGMVALLVVLGHISLILMYGTMAPCRAAAKRIADATYEGMPPPKSAASELGRQRGRSWAQEPLERLVYADMASGSVTQCYAVAFRVAKPVSRSER